MAQWQQVQAMGSSEVNQRVLQLYRKEGIPVEVRHFLCDVIENPKWDLLGNTSVTLNDEQKWMRSSELLNALIEALQQRLDGEQNIVERSKWQGHIDHFKRTFFQPQGKCLYDVLHNCLQEEKQILASSNQHLERPPASPTVPVNYPPHMLMKSIMKYCERIHQTINMINCNKLREIDIEYNKLAETRVCNEELNERRMNIKHAVQEYIRTVKEDVVESTNSRIIGPLWKLLEIWTLETKDNFICSKSESVHLEQLENVCQKANECILYVLRILKHFIHNFCCLKDDGSIQYLHAGLEELFAKHLKRIFVVAEQPERIVNVSKDRTNNFHLTLSILGGAALDLYSHPQPSIDVQLQAYQEKDLVKIREENEIPKSIWIVTNNTGVFEPCKYTLKMEDISVRDSATATRRRHTGEPRGQKKTLAAEEKNLIVAFTKITVGDKKYDIEAYTLPMMFITQPSQNWTAKGALVWFTAFSDKCNKEGIPVTEKAEVKSMEVAEMLKNVFYKFTGAENLADEHVDYLVRRLLRVRDQDTDISKLLVKRDTFLKDDNRTSNNGAKFSFWKWFLACINLVENKLKYEWKMKLIYGFCDKKRADQLLKSKDPKQGAFLLRFSESAIENSASSTYSANLTVCVLEKSPTTGELKTYHINKHLKGEDLVNRSLSSVVRGMEIEDSTWNGHDGGRRQLLCYLYPDNRPVEEAFGTRCDPDPDDPDPDHYQDCYVDDNRIEEKFLVTLWPKNPGMFPLDDSPPASVESTESFLHDQHHIGLAQQYQVMQQQQQQQQSTCMSPPSTCWDPTQVPSPPQHPIHVPMSPAHPGMVPPNYIQPDPSGRVYPSPQPPTLTDFRVTTGELPILSPEDLGLDDLCVFKND